MLEGQSAQSKLSPEQLLVSILESTSNIILTFESVEDDSGDVSDFRCVFVNKVGMQVFGTDHGELVDQRLTAFAALRPHDTFIGRLREVVQSQRMSTFEHRMEEEGQFFRVTAVHVPGGVTVNMMDITALRETQQEMETEEIKYRRLFDESIDAICLIDDNFNIREANSSCLEMFDYEWKDLHCLSLPELTTDHEKFEVFQKKLASSGRAEEFEIPLQTRQGKTKYSLLNGVVLEDEDGHPVYLVVIKDLTRRKRTERDLLRAEKLSMTGKIARTIAHEVRNPLTNLTLVVDQLKEEVEEHSEDADMYFEIVSRNIDRIGNLITDLLNSSKPRELALVEQSLNKLVMQALDLVRDRVTLREMKLEVDLMDEPDSLPLDADQFKVALLNLFINAIEAMEGGRGVLKVSTERQDQEVRVLISDNGVGISEEDLKQLFEPYFTGKKQGTGLGLTTVQNIIHSHKAKISVDSEVGEGTTFEISFDVPNL